MIDNVIGTMDYEFEGVTYKVNVIAEDNERGAIDFRTKVVGTETIEKLSDVLESEFMYTSLTSRELIDDDYVKVLRPIYQDDE